MVINGKYQDFFSRFFICLPLCPVGPTMQPMNSADHQKTSVSLQQKNGDVETWHWHTTGSHSL